MFSRTHLSASAWSQRPKFPAKPSRPFEPNPEIFAFYKWLLLLAETERKNQTITKNAEAIINHYKHYLATHVQIDQRLFVVKL